MGGMTHLSLQGSFEGDAGSDGFRGGSTVIFGGSVFA
jgi:hypothetical protein